MCYHITFHELVFSSNHHVSSRKWPTKNKFLTKCIVSTQIPGNLKYQIFFSLRISVEILKCAQNDAVRSKWYVDWNFSKYYCILCCFFVFIQITLGSITLFCLKCLNWNSPFLFKEANYLSRILFWFCFSSSFEWIKRRKKIVRLAIEHKEKSLLFSFNWPISFQIFCCKMSKYSPSKQRTTKLL